MSSNTAMQLAPLPLGIGLAGCWTLPSTRAIKLGAASGGFLQVAQGTVWATLDGPHQGPANDWGDRVLRCGTRIHLTAGQQVVLEPYQRAANEKTCFSWEPDLQASAPTVRPGVLRKGWHAVGAVLQRLGQVLGRWLAPAPAWSPQHGAQHDEQVRDHAWRDLYHLRTNQP